MGIPSRYSGQRVAFMCMMFLAGWMTLIAGVVILRWTSMTEAEQALSIITPEQMMLNVFAAAIFWGLVGVVRHNTTVAGVVGIAFYLLFCLGTVAAVGNKARDINQAQGLKLGEEGWQMPIQMITGPGAMITHALRLLLLGVVLRAKGVVVGNTPAAAIPVPHYTTPEQLANDRKPERRSPTASDADSAPQGQAENIEHAPYEELTPTVRQIQPLVTRASAQ